MEIKKFLKTIFSETRCVRILMFLEVVVLCLDVGFLVIGVVMYVNSDVIKHKQAISVLQAVSFNGSLKFGSVVERLPIMIMIIGALAFLFAIFGAASVCYAKRRLYVTHAYLMTLLFITHLIFLALVYVTDDTIDDTVQAELRELLKKYEGIESNRTESIGWDYIFLNLDCCGVDAVTNTTNSGEFQDTAWWPLRTTTLDLVPQSCCTGATEGNYLYYNADIACQRTLLAHRKTGCYDAIRNWITPYTSAIKGLGVVLLIVEMLVIPVTFVVCVMIDKRTVIPEKQVS